MEFVHSFLVFLALASIFLSPEVIAQSNDTSRNMAQSLDALLQDYAYRAFVRPRTGVPFYAQAPSNFSGIKLAAMRLRSGSLRSKGVRNYSEFEIPKGVVVRPYLVRLVLVYQNLGSWSSIYYGLSGYTFLTPVIGLLAYDASNLSATNLPKLNITVSQEPISIRFSDVGTVPSGLTPKCVSFGLQVLPELSNLTSTNVCSTRQQGHFAIVVQSTAPSPAPTAPPNQGPTSPTGGNDKSRVWKIAAPVVAVSALLVLGAFLVLWLQKYKQKKKVAEMERQAEMGEALQMTSIGDTRAPIAMGTRTPPVLENEYVP